MAPKRASIGGRGSPAKKAKKDSVPAKCALVQDILKHASDFPPDVLKMLAKIASDSLSKPTEERHDFQSKIAAMIGEVLHSVANERKNHVLDCEATVGAADTEKATREAALATTTEDAAKKAEEAEAAKKAAQEASAAASTAADALRMAKDEVKKGDADFEKAKQTKATLDEVISVEYEYLKKGEGRGTAKPLKAVMKLGRTFNIDSFLLSSAETTLAKTLSQRGTFDGLVIKELDALFASFVATTEGTIASDEAARTARAAKVDAATEALSSATAAEAAQKAASDAAAMASKEAEAAKKVAATAVKDYGKDMKQAAAELASAQSAAKEMEKVMAAFKELLERTEIEPPAEEGAAAPAAEA